MKKDKQNVNVNNKIHVKKALIVFPIVAVLAGTTLFGAFSPLFMDEQNVVQSESNEDVIGKSLEAVASDEKAQKIIDIHENLENYIDKEVTLEGFFTNLGEGTSVFGVEVPLGDGEIMPISLSYKLSDADALKNIKDTDLTKVSGKITSFEELHEDDEKGDHNHTTPMFNIDKIDVIR